MVTASRQSIATRSGVVRARSRIQRPRVKVAHWRNSVTTSTNGSGCSQKKRWPPPGKSSTRASGIRRCEQGGVPRVDDRVFRPVQDERRRVRSPPRRSRASKAAPAAACALQASNGCAVASRWRRIRSTSSVVRLRRERVLDELGAASRRSCSSFDRLLGHRERLRPAGRRAGEHEPVDALRMRRARAPARPCRRGSPRARARARPRPRRAPAPASSASPATVYGPGGASLSPMPRLSKRITSKRARERLDDGSQPQRA